MAFADAVGDANYVNDQGAGAVPIGDEGPDTRPASLASADLVEGRYETAYGSVPEHDEAGRLVAVRRVPTALRVHLRTAAPAIPSFGPTVVLEMWVRSGGCPMIFRLWARGPHSGEHDPQEGAELRTRSADCPEGAKSYTEDLGMDLRGQTTVLEFPFAALQTPAGPLIEPGDEIGPDPDGRAARTASVHGLPNGLLVGGPTIDQASPLNPFVIGSDIPPDVDCVATPSDAECLGEEASPDTGLDLHAAMLGSGEPVRAGPGSTLDLAEEFGVYSFRPDGRWMSFGFDVAAAGFTQPWVEVNLATRLMRDGEASDEWLTISDSFASWKLVYGPADDPYRHLASLFQDTPWGMTVALPSDGLDRLTLLASADVRGGEHVGVVLALRGTNDAFFAEPFPGSFAPWMESWTQGRRKVRLEEDRWGRGVEATAWFSQQGATFSYDARRGVAVEDDRTRIAGVAEPGSMRLAGTLESAGPALTAAWLLYSAAADQDLVLEWRTPTETRRGSRSSLGSSGASLFAMVPDGGPGGYGLTLEVESGLERSSSLTYIQDLWPLDPAELFPGLEGRFTSSPETDPVVLIPGMTVAGPAPQLVVGLAPDATR